jgi:hypothetical protein
MKIQNAATGELNKKKKTEETFNIILCSRTRGRVFERTRSNF